eukprot:3938639-Rhodomonas_salina.2
MTVHARWCETHTGTCNRKDKDWSMPQETGGHTLKYAAGMSVESTPPPSTVIAFGGNVVYLQCDFEISLLSFFVSRIRIALPPSLSY